MVVGQVRLLELLVQQLIVLQEEQQQIVKQQIGLFKITQEGELNHYGTQFAYSFNGDIDNGSNTAVTESPPAGSFTDDSTTQTKFNAKSAHFTNSGYSVYNTL